MTMGDIVNLRTARKQKSRDRAVDEAASNRAKFGRTKAEKERDRKSADDVARRLDQSKLDD